VQAGGWLPFTVSDPDGDSVVTYRFTDVGTGATSAQLWTSGHGAWAQGSTVDVAAGQLSNLWIGGGSSTGTDALQVSVFDGYQWSATADITVNSVETAPVVTATGAQTLAPGGWVPASGLPFTVSDAQGDSIQTYRFTDVGTSASSAQLWANWAGGYIAQGGSIDVSAANLSGLWLQGDTSGGIDTVRVQAYDGFQWSAAKDVAVVTSSTPINGNAGAVVVTGATGGNDTLLGSVASDTFIFAPSFGHDTVVAFTPGQDVIAIDHSIFASAVALLANTADDGGGNAVVTVDASNSITFQGVSTLLLQQHQSDFHIV